MNQEQNLRMSMAKEDSINKIKIFTFNQNKQ